MALKKDLTHTCPDSGVSFELRPIPPLNFDDFNNAYDEMNPRPVPPLTEINVAGKLISQPDSRDPYFTMLLETWGSKKEAVARHFMLARGVVNDPPDDYLPDELIYTGKLSEGKRKALWVSDQLHTINDLKSLIEAIQSIGTVTEEGIEQAKNDLTPQPAASLSGNGVSNPVLTQSDSTFP